MPINPININDHIEWYSYSLILHKGTFVDHLRKSINTAIKNGAKSHEVAIKKGHFTNSKGKEIEYDLDEDEIEKKMVSDPSKPFQQSAVAKEMNIPETTLSDYLNDDDKSKAGNKFPSVDGFTRLIEYFKKHIPDFDVDYLFTGNEIYKTPKKTDR